MAEENTFIKIKATYYRQVDSRNGRIQWVVRYGKPVGKPGKYITKAFMVGEELERDTWVRDWNEALEKENAATLSTMSAVDKAELNVCFKLLDGTGVTLRQCVEYYLEHNPSNSSKLSFSEAVDIIKKWRIEVKKHPAKRVNEAIMTTLRPFGKFVKNKQISAITQQDCKKFLFSKKNWSIATQYAHKRNLSAFFGHLTKNNYPNVNPVKNVELPDKHGDEPKAFYRAFEVWLFLDLCLSNKKHTLLGGAILSALCGGRLQESTRVRFSQIKRKQGLIVYHAKEAKTKQRRCVYGSAVAFEWLKQVKRKNDQTTISSAHAVKVIQTDIKKRVEDFLKSHGSAATKGQNLLRQAFEAHAFYHFNHDLRAIAEVSGNSPETLKKDYNGCLDDAGDAEIYFNLYPRRSLIEGYDKALELNLWQSEHLDGVVLEEWSIGKQKLPDGEKGKGRFLFHEPSINEALLHTESPHWDGNWKKALGKEGMFIWEDEGEVLSPPKGFDVKGKEAKYHEIYKAVEFALTYGFDPTDKEMLMKLREVREYLIRHLGKQFVLGKGSICHG